MSGTALMHLTSSADRLADICFNDWGPFYLYGLTLIPAWISNYINYNAWDETYTVEVREWISNFSAHFPGHVIIYPCWDLS